MSVSKRELLLRRAEEQRRLFHDEEACQQLLKEADKVSKPMYVLKGDEVWRK